MNKAQLVELVARKTLLTKVQSEQVIDATIHIITAAVSRGDEVKIVGFGTFLRGSRQARNGRNPKTGGTIPIPATRVPKFKPGKDFRDRITK